MVVNESSRLLMPLSPVGEQPPGAAVSGFFVASLLRGLDDMGHAHSTHMGHGRQLGFGVIGCPVRRGSYDRERPKDKRVSIDLSSVPTLGSGSREAANPATVQGWLCSALSSLLVAEPMWLTPTVVKTIVGDT